MTIIPLAAAQVAACLYVLYICVMVLHAMSGTTRILVRLSFLLLSAGALSGAVTALANPSFTNTLMAIGLALFLAANERREPCGLSS